MHWINRLFMRAKVDQQVSWWSGGQTCYQVLLKILEKPRKSLVLAFDRT